MVFFLSDRVCFNLNLLTFPITHGMPERASLGTLRSAVAPLLDCKRLPPPPRALSPTFVRKLKASIRMAWNPTQCLGTLATGSLQASPHLKLRDLLDVTHSGISAL